MKIKTACIALALMVAANPSFADDNNTITVDAFKLSILYAQNKIAGEKLLEGKRVIINGPIMRVDIKQLGDPPVIEFISENEFLPITAILDPKDTDVAATLRPGQYVSVKCRAMMAGNWPVPSGAGCMLLSPK